MKNGIATHSVRREYYVIQIDGQAKAGHRRLLMHHEQPCCSETSFRSTTSKCGQLQNSAANCFELTWRSLLANMTRAAATAQRCEGLNLLAPGYGWFAEGFDTLDLKEAKALLDELRA